MSADSDGNPETAGRFRVETGDREVDEMISPVNSPVHLENPESQTRWYFKYFLGKCKLLQRKIKMKIRSILFLTSHYICRLQTLFSQKQIEERHLEVFLYLIDKFYLLTCTKKHFSRISHISDITATLLCVPKPKPNRTITCTFVHCVIGL